MRRELLDHGYVELVETLGSDERIIEAARMSTQKGFRGWGATCEECGFAKTSCRNEFNDHEAGCSHPGRWKDGDEKLLRYLWTNNHATPFEFAGAVFEVRAPLFVFREWHRHRTQSYNEASARYGPLPALDYVPSVERILRNAGGTNKQAGRAEGSPAPSMKDAAWFQDELHRLQDSAERVYEDALLRGIPKELARLSMTVGRYSTMRTQANLRNWLAFVTLRADPKAQEEIRVYADAVLEMLGEKFPRTIALFKEGRSNG